MMISFHLYNSIKLSQYDADTSGISSVLLTD